LERKGCRGPEPPSCSQAWLKGSDTGGRQPGSSLQRSFSRGPARGASDEPRGSVGSRQEDRCGGRLAHCGLALGRSGKGGCWASSPRSAYGSSAHATSAAHAPTSVGTTRSRWRTSDVGVPGGLARFAVTACAPVTTASSSIACSACMATPLAPSSSRSSCRCTPPSWALRACEDRRRLPSHGSDPASHAMDRHGSRRDRRRLLVALRLLRQGQRAAGRRVLRAAAPTVPSSRRFFRRHLRAGCLAPARCLRSGRERRRDGGCPHGAGGDVDRGASRRGVLR